MTKEEIKEILDANGIEYPADASKSDLETLLPENEGVEEVEQATEPEVSGDRASRWTAFLAKAQAQNPVKYAVKEARGEFKQIPASFK